TASAADRGIERIGRSGGGRCGPARRDSDEQGGGGSRCGERGVVTKHDLNSAMGGTGVAWVRRHERARAPCSRARTRIAESDQKAAVTKVWRRTAGARRPA